ncbi:MAG TPA: polyprenyl synthetase family protein [Candidatus Kryptonia bacterium]|nr:polyprenyl synthetase family protein [Candidatus Kryptonia bacterium]
MNSALPRSARATTGAAGVRIAAELTQVEQRLGELIASREPLLSEIARYLVASGGKRVRPAVAILVFRACGGENLTDIVDAAAALELIHSATLLHDDIIDGSDVRRGNDSALRKYGLADTLVTGDYLFCRAFQLCARFEEQVVGWAAEACVSLTEGEILQARFRHNPAVTLDDYLEIITRKTASLFQQGARTGAHLAGADAAIVDRMRRCGFSVGLAFQMVDDLLDVTGTEASIGKPVGIDLRDGNPSLPVVLAMRSDAELRRLFAKPEPTGADISAAIARIRRADVLDQVRTLACDHAERARAEMAAIPPSGYRDDLLDLIDQLVDRVS